MGSYSDLEGKTPAQLCKNIKCASLSKKRVTNPQSRCARGSVSREIWMIPITIPKPENQSNISVLPIPAQKTTDFLSTYPTYC
jgi:hypothetical protein